MGPSYQRVFIYYKSEFEGFALRSSWRKERDTHFTLSDSIRGREDVLVVEAFSAHESLLVPSTSPVNLMTGESLSTADQPDSEPSMPKFGSARSGPMLRRERIP